MEPFLATDHAPHAMAEISRPSIWENACGFPGVETSMRLMLTLVAEGRFTLEQYVRAASAAPARAFSLYPRKGVVQPGADGDLAIIDLAARGTIEAAALHSERSRFTPYEGMRTIGLPVAEAAGWGRMERPAMPAPAPRNLATTTEAILRPGAIPF